jgi:hypothetical protein
VRVMSSLDDVRGPASLSENSPEDFLKDSPTSDSSGSSSAVTNDELLMGDDGDDGWVVPETPGGPCTGNVRTGSEWLLADASGKVAQEDDRGPSGSMVIGPPPPSRRMLRRKDLRREFFLDDALDSERSKGTTFAGSDVEEGLGCDDVLLVFGLLERADVRTDSQGVLSISRRAMLGEDGELLRRIRILSMSARLGSLSETGPVKFP